MQVAMGCQQGTPDSPVLWDIMLAAMPGVAGSVRGAHAAECGSSRGCRSRTGDSPCGATSQVTTFALAHSTDSVGKHHLSGKADHSRTHGPSASSDLSGLDKVLGHEDNPLHQCRRPRAARPALAQRRIYSFAFVGSTHLANARSPRALRASGGRTRTGIGPQNAIWGSDHAFLFPLKQKQKRKSR